MIDDWFVTPHRSAQYFHLLTRIKNHSRPERKRGKTHAAFMRKMLRQTTRCYPIILLATPKVEETVGKPFIVEWPFIMYFIAWRCIVFLMIEWKYLPLPLQTLNLMTHNWCTQRYLSKRFGPVYLCCGPPWWDKCGIHKPVGF